MIYSPELLARGWLFVRGDDEEVVDERTGWDELPPTDIGSTTKSGSCSESDSYNQFTKSMKITQILLIQLTHYAASKYEILYIGSSH